MIIIHCKIKVVCQDPGDLFKMFIAVIMVLSSSWYDWFSNLKRRHFYESELERERETESSRYTDCYWYGYLQNCKLPQKGRRRRRNIRIMTINIWLTKFIWGRLSWWVIHSSNYRHNRLKWFGKIWKEILVVSVVNGNSIRVRSWCVRLILRVSESSGDASFSLCKCYMHFLMV